MTTRRRPRLPLLFLGWGLVPGALAVSGLARGPVRAWELGVAAFAVCWAVAGVGLLRDRPGAGVRALGLTLVPWLLAAAQTARRVWFVVRTGRLEGEDGVGSPMAFLLGVAVEQMLVFLPLTALAILLGLAERRRRGRRP